MNDNVNHPSHYNSHKSGVEAIEVCRSMSFNIGNSFKYVFRRNDKDNIIENLEKARFYIIEELARRRTLKYNFISYLANFINFRILNEYFERDKIVMKIALHEQDAYIGEIYINLSRADFEVHNKHVLEKLEQRLSTMIEFEKSKKIKMLIT